MDRLDREKPRVIAAGDAAALAVFGDEMTLEMTRLVQEVTGGLTRLRAPGILDVVPAYCTLLVHFDPMVTSFDAVELLIEQAMDQGSEETAGEARLREIPVVYGRAYGPDLPAVAEQLHLSEEEIVRRHSSSTYTVCTLGFAPGQPYVVGLPPELAMPRRLRPRELVPMGAVTMANQTNIYPLPNPTGWWWIGRTYLRLFDPSADPPTYLQPGDQIRFLPIDEAEYLRRGGDRATI